MNDPKSTPPCAGHDRKSSRAFAWVLCEELGEIRELRKKRQWDKEGDTSRHSPPPPDGPCAKEPSPSIVRCDRCDTADPAAYGDDIIKSAHNESLVGLAFSGGGIRSATFNLGVLQGFANRGCLPMFDYLSTVSGGGYIGSWLEAWIARTAKDPKETNCDDKERASASSQTPIRKVQECLKTKRATKPGHLEPRPIRFLREYSNYLTPRLGLLGADTWTAVAIYLRNLILNQAILILFLASTLLLPYIATWMASMVVSLFDTAWSGFALPAVAFVLVLFAQIMVSRNMKFLAGRLVGEETRYPSSAQQGQILLQIATPLVLAAWVTSVWQWANGDRWPWWDWPLAGMFAFGVTWAVAALWNLPKTGPAAPPYGRPSAWCFSIGFSLISGGVGGLLLWVLANEIYAKWAGNAEFWNAVGFGTPLVIQVFLLVGTLQIGLMGLLFPDPRREWWGRLGGWLLIISLNWAAFFLAAAYAPLGLMWMKGWVRGAGLAWISTTLVGIWGGKSGTSGGLGSRSWKDIALSATPYVFIAGLVAIIAWMLEVGLALLNKMDPAQISRFLAGSPVAEKVGGWVVSLEYTLSGGNGHALQTVTPNQPPAPGSEYINAHWGILWAALNWKLLLVLAALLAICLILARRVNLNEFSMNLFYRNRLVRAYLGASHKERKPNPFTGLDPYDDILLRDFRHELCYSGPFPIVNTTLNVVSGKDLAWQERKAESFVMTPLRCGFDTRLEQIDLEQGSPTEMPEDVSKYGYRPTEHYLYEDFGPRMGTAVSISGAAASPNMGYHSIPSLAFLMTFFNVRLGFWCGNPRNKTWTEPGPKLGLVHLLAELFGETDDESRYVYLSDGGHFENLGVYELVKRRCKFIVVSDAGADGSYTFGDLGNAIRKCREDFGIEIEIETKHLVPDKNTKLTAWHCAIGTIHYGQVDPGAKNGILVYLKASLSGDEMADILNYHREHPDFPHQSTADQWFTESQFESYRRLGQHVVEWLMDPLGNPDDPPMKTADLFARLADHWSTTP